MLGNTAARVANAANGILKHAAIAMPLKYPSNFWRSLEIPLTNCKIEIKLKWTKYCVLSPACADNVNGSVDENANGNTTIFTIKIQKNLCSCINFITKRRSKFIKTSK